MKMPKRLEYMLSAIQAIKGYQVSSFGEFECNNNYQAMNRNAIIAIR